VEPHNAELIHYLQRCEELRAQNLPTLPSTIEQDPAVFAAIRQWKNEFK